MEMFEDTVKDAVEDTVEEVTLSISYDSRLVYVAFLYVSGR
jgi:hypothetical protein